MTGDHQVDQQVMIVIIRSIGRLMTSDMPAAGGKLALGGFANRKNAAIAPRYQVILCKYNDFDDS
jgi:hypothetical protein